MAQEIDKGAGGVEPALRTPSRWHDPLGLIQDQAPATGGRIVLWSVSLLTLVLMVWAAVSQLDIIVSAEGKLAPQTLVKIVQPAESGIVRELLVQEGDSVRQGQVLARLDMTLARAEAAGIGSDLAAQRLQVRRIEAELNDRPMVAQAGDDPLRYAEVLRQYGAHRQAFLDSLAQERALLVKAEQEKRAALETQDKLQQTLPAYQAAADNVADLAREGYIPALRSLEKQREATEKRKELDGQRAAVAALSAAVLAQQQKISQLQNTYKSELERELAELRARIAQLEPGLEKSHFKEGLMELRAPQNGVIKDLATTTVGAVVQPGTVVLTLVPDNESLFADVLLKNEDIGFVEVGQPAQIKLVTYPFQKYGMLHGKVVHVSADAAEPGKGALPAAAGGEPGAAAASMAWYKVRLRLDAQVLKDPRGVPLRLNAGMQVVAEIQQGKRSVLEYFLSPVQKTLASAARER